MTGIAALAAAAAATSKITSSITGTTATSTIAGSAGQTIKVVQAAGNVITAGGKPIQAGQTAIIGGQTVRLATPGGTLLKAGNTITQGGKQIILQKQGNQPQIVTLVKTSQGMQVNCLNYRYRFLLKLHLSQSYRIFFYLFYVEGMKYIIIKYRFQFPNQQFPFPSN